MIKNNVYYELFASIQVPNHEEVGYWIDLGADPHGNIIKFFDKTINRWVKLTDASSEYATPPYIGNNGNWFIENRDSGVPAAGKNPYIGEDNYWFVFVPSENKYVNTGIMAKGLSAYELAVKHGFKGTEEEWIEYLRKPALDAAAAALEAADKANEATEDAKVATAKADIATENAQNAADRSNEIADNPPKIVNEEWYMYDELTKEYKPTGIKAIGDPFEIKKTYKSIADMEADYDNPMIGVGQFVWINTGNVEDPDDSKLFLKGTDGWILVGDLSGNQGIQGLSAYEVAVENGYVGTEEDWIQSLKQPSLDAAAEALEAKAQVEATEAAVKAAEALRVTAEEGRVTAETTRESNEATRKTNESGRVTAENARVVAENARASAENARAANEDTRKSNESTRITQENTRQTNESTRINSEAGRVASETARETAEATRVTQEQGRVDAEAIRVANENARKDAETDRSDAEDIRIANEADRVANEAIRETQETERQTNTAEAITAVNEAKTAAQAATTNANTAASNANTQANRAKEYSDNPPKIENDRWWVWDEVNDTYVNTEVFATGEPGKSPIIQDGTWWVYNNETSEYQDTLIPVTTPYQLTKEKVEAVLTGEIKSHHHDGFYYTEYEIDQKVATINSEFDNYLSKDNTTEFIPTDDYNPATKKYVDGEITKVNTALDTKIDKSSAGVANGIAQLDLTGKVPASQLPSFVDDVLEFDSADSFPTEGESGKIYIAVDTNITYRWSGSQYTMISSSLALGETSSTAYPGDKGKANADKLATIESGAQVNVIENVKARGADLPITDKRVIVPEDIAIGDTEPTGDELIWFNTSEDYLFEFGGYTKEDADAKFVAKEAGKGLSTNDYTNEEKASLADKLGTVTKVGNDGNVVSNIEKLGTDIRVYKTTALTETTGDDRYVKKSGDTMTGVLTLDSPNDAGKSRIDIKRAGVVKGYLGDGATGENQAIIINNAVTNKSIQLKNTGELTYDGINIALVDGIKEIAVRNSTENNKRAILGNDGLAIVPSVNTSNPGIAYVNMDRTAVLGGIGATLTGNTLKNLYIGWGSASPNSANNLTVGQNAFTYKNNTIYHSGNRGEIFPTYINWLLSNSKNTTLITVGGDKDTFYPVYIAFENSHQGSQLPTKCWIQRALGTASPNWDGNHSGGTSSLNVGWEFRANGWDGNGNYIKTLINKQDYAPLVARIEPGFYSWGGLVVWLRGGTAEYRITTDGEIRLTNCENGPITIENDTYNPILLADINSWNRGVTSTGPFSIGEVSGSSFGVRISDQLFVYNYISSHNAPAIIMDKPGANRFGVGPIGDSNVQTIRYGACDQENPQTRHTWAGTNNTFKHYFDGDIYTQGGTSKVVTANELEDNLAYWYENNENQSTTVLNTGGNRDVIESLRSKFKRCIAKPYGEDAALISFCNETNSNVWPDGSQMNIDGGRKENRMTYFPKYYHKTVEMSSGVWRTYISEMQLDDDYIEEPEMLLSTFEAFNNNGVLYSGSGLTSTGSQTMATFVTQAKTNGPLWGIGDYRSHATIARMFCAYYGNTNISTSNSSIPCSGGTKRWDQGKTGGTLSLGNADGKTPVNGDTGYYSTNFLGLEDCYYSKWEFVQGVNVISGKWVVYDGGSFPDKDVADLETAGATNIRIAGNAAYNASAAGSGWTKKISHGRYGDVVPTEMGGSDSTYYADYYWYNTGNKIVLRSGGSGYGSRCGVFVAIADCSSSTSWASIGSRLAFYGKIVVVDSDDFKKTQS